VLLVRLSRFEQHFWFGSISDWYPETFPDFRRVSRTDAPWWCPRGRNEGSTRASIGFGCSGISCRFFKIPLTRLRGAGRGGTGGFRDFTGAGGELRSIVSICSWIFTIWTGKLAGRGLDVRRAGEGCCGITGGSLDDFK